MEQANVRKTFSSSVDIIDEDNINLDYLYKKYQQLSERLEERLMKIKNKRANTDK